MKRIKSKISSWEEGRKFMQAMSSEFKVDIEEIVDGNLKVENDEFTITCHFDPREYAYILIKVEEDSSSLEQIKSHLNEYPKYSS